MLAEIVTFVFWIVSLQTVNFNAFSDSVCVSQLIESRVLVATSIKSIFLSHSARKGEKFFEKICICHFCSKPCVLTAKYLPCFENRQNVFSFNFAIKTLASIVHCSTKNLLMYKLGISTAHNFVFQSRRNGDWTHNLTEHLIVGLILTNQLRYKLNKQMNIFS